MHPLHLLAIGYIAGLLAGGASFAPAEAGAASFIAAALALPLAVFIVLGRRTRGEARGVQAALLVLAGLIASLAVPALHRHRTPAHHLLRHVPYERMNVTGRLVRPVERAGGASRRPRVYLEVERALIRGVEVPMTGVARVTLASRLKAPPPPEWGIGCSSGARASSLPRASRTRARSTTGSSCVCGASTP